MFMRINPYIFIMDKLLSDPTISQKKSMLLRINHRRRIKWVLIDRICTLCFVSVVPLFCLLTRLKLTKDAVFVQLFKVGSNKFQQGFIASNEPRIDVSMEIPLIDGMKFYIGKHGAVAWCRNFKTWFWFWCASVLGLFYRKPIPLITIVPALVATMSIANQKGVHIYVFSMFSPNSYLTAVLAEDLSSNELHLCAGGSMLYYFNRYLTIPSAELILCSRFQTEEVRSYMCRQWINVKSTRLWNPEAFSAFLTASQTKPCYDIGIYSSGVWARANGRYRIDSPRKILDLGSNASYEAFITDILEPIIDIKDTMGYKVKLYPHPYERMLFTNYGILPPYLDILKAAGIEFDDLQEENSVGKIYECKIAVTLVSTLCMDRWHLGLPGLIYSGAVNRDVFRPEYLGEYEQNFFSNGCELQNRLIDYLGK